MSPELLPDQEFFVLRAKCRPGHHESREELDFYRAETQRRKDAGLGCLPPEEVEAQRAKRDAKRAKREALIANTEAVAILNLTLRDKGNAVAHVLRELMAYANTYDPLYIKAEEAIKAWRVASVKQNFLKL